MFLKNKILFFSLVLISLSTNMFSQEASTKSYNQNDVQEKLISFSNLEDLTATFDEESYINTIRESVINQPEYRSSIALSEEKRLLLANARREFFPTLSSRIINDEIIDKSIAPTDSIRKRQDDSFDAVVEFNQNLYTGGKILGGINFARYDDQSFKVQQKQTTSELFLEANTIYLTAYISNFLYSYAFNILNDLRPYKQRIKDRVSAGVNDPVDLAVFSVNMNKLESLIYNLEARASRDLANYEYFFSTKSKPIGLPLFTIYKNIALSNSKAFTTEIKKLEYQKSLEEVKIVRSDYMPKLGFSLRYTEYDIDKNNIEDNDIRGGLFFSLPIFDFGRGRTKVNAAKAKSRSYLMDIDVDKKNNASIEKEIQAKFFAAINARNQLLQAFNDTKNQRKIIENRINVSGFAATTLVNTAEKEIQQLQTLLTSEYDILLSYLELAHQRQMLMNLFYTD